jgi:hypothetical protein
MSRIWTMIDIASLIFVVVLVGGYWAARDKKAEKDGKP